MSREDEATVAWKGKKKSLVAAVDAPSRPREGRKEDMKK